MTGARVFAPLFLTLLAEALALAGKIEEGLAALDEALAKAAASGERGWERTAQRGEVTTGIARIRDGMATWRTSNPAPPSGSNNPGRFAKLFREAFGQLPTQILPQTGPV
jgi:predicted ATPase